MKKILLSQSEEGSDVSEKDLKRHGIRVDITDEMIAAQCRHWKYDGKGKNKHLRPDIKVLPDCKDNSRVKCQFCGTVFPIKPMMIDEFKQMGEQMIDMINFIDFYSVRSFKSSPDVLQKNKDLFMALKQIVPEFFTYGEEIIEDLSKRMERESQKDIIISNLKNDNDSSELENNDAGETSTIE